MSQYLSFELINKDNPDIKVDLGYWCTSIARGISWNFEDIFKYTGENDVTLDIDTLKSYIDRIEGQSPQRAGKKKRKYRTSNQSTDTSGGGCYQRIYRYER